MVTSVIGALSVEITVDSQGVKDGIKASGDALAIGGKQLRKGANEWGKWALAAVAATTAVTAAIVKTNLTNIRELKHAATAADETVEAFQRGAYAAEQFGVSQEKYGDILKDVNDRVGDFLTTGAGPMVDFFETIGPKVNVTADSFKNLSGSQSLGLYISSLQKAGASQQEMTFFMEALAGDATRLIPLFEDNAKAFNTLTFEAKALGIGLSAIDVEKAEMASKSIAKSLAVTEAFGQELTVQLAPIVSKVIDLFEEMAVNAGGASQLISKGISGVIDVVGVFADGLHGVNIIFKGLEIAALGFSALATNVFAAVTTVIATSVDGWMMMINDAIVNINSAFDTGIEPLDLLGDSNAVKGIQKTADDMISVVSTANGELHDLLMEPLPSDQIKNFADAAIAEFDRVATAKVAVDGGNTTKTKAPKDEASAAAAAAAARRVREEDDAILSELINQGNLKAETLTERYAREHQILVDALGNDQLTREEFARAEEELDRKVAISKVSQLGSTLSAMATALTIGGNKNNKIQKKLAIAGAIVSGGAAAVDAYAAGASVGGPFALITGAAYAAASIATTAGMIANIKSGGKASAGGGRTPSIQSSGGGGGVSSDGYNKQASSRNISINLQGEGLMSTSQVRELIGQINEATGDGVQLIT